MTLPLVRRVTLSLALVPAIAFATDGPFQPNFTGPLVTPAVNTLPTGMLNVEPYLIHTNVRGAYDNSKQRHGHALTARQWMLAVPATYGITDTLAVQLTLNASRTSDASGHTDGMRMGDATVRLQQRLHGPGESGTGWVVAVAAAQRLPTGSYHHLDANPLNGTGNGSMRTTFALGAQKLQWLPGGQALRWRGQLAWSPTPGHVRVHDASVYGTARGFRGHAKPGQAWNASIAAEYALDTRWVLVGEAVWNRSGSVRMQGQQHGAASQWRVSPSQDISLAPAVEYHFSPTIGLIGGVQFTVAGRNAGSYVAPQAALNMVF